MSNIQNNDDNKSSFSFEVQIDLDKKGQEGFGFEDFPDFEQLKAEKERSYIDQPNFDPKQVKESARMNQSANPFAAGSDQASRDNTRSVVPVEEYIYNPFMTAEGSSHNTSLVKQIDNPFSPGIKRQDSLITRGGQVSFGPIPQARTQSATTAPPPPQPQSPSQPKPQPSQQPLHSQFHPVRQKFVPKQPVSQPSGQGQSNFFTFKRNLQNSRMTAAEILVSSLDSVRAQIDYYKQAIEKMQYESVRMAEKELEMTLVTQQADERLANCSKQIVKINEKLQELLRYQQQLTSSLRKTVEQRDSLIEEIRQGLACEQQDTPTTEQTQLYLQLEQINKALQQIEVDTEQLQMSQLLSQGPPVQREVQSYSAMLSKLYGLAQGIGYPKLVYNVKMSCTRNRWILWENAQLQVGVIYQKKPKQLSVELHLGNKTKRQLLQFTLIFSDQPQPIFNKEILRQLSYMRAVRRSANILQGLCPFAISYDIQLGKTNTIQLTVPITFLHFGEFEAITPALFKKKWKKLAAKHKSQYCVPDKDIVQGLMDVKKYLHNLLEIQGKTGQVKLAGLFRFSSGVTVGQEIMIKISEKQGMLGMTVASLTGANGQVFSGETLAVIANTLTFIFAV